MVLVIALLVVLPGVSQARLNDRELQTEVSSANAICAPDFTFICTTYGGATGRLLEKDKFPLLNWVAPRVGCRTMCVHPFFISMYIRFGGWKCGICDDGV